MPEDSIKAHNQVMAVCFCSTEGVHINLTDIFIP